MDINCNLFCKHQVDGKCMLTQITSPAQINTENNEMDCVYYEEAK